MHLLKTEAVTTDVKKPIRSRLIRIVLFSIGVTSLITMLAGSWLEIGRFNESREKEAYAVAHIFSAAVSDPLARNDRLSALKALRAISKIPAFQLAQVRNSNNNIFAELGGAVQIKRDDSRSLIFKRNLKITVPIIKSGQKIGSLIVVIDTSDLKGHLIEKILVGLFASIIAGIVGIIIAIRLQERITNPLHNLSQSMFEVRNTQNFKRVVTRRSDDETGLLVDAFNDMMAHIDERDKRLKAHRENLETEVEHRTIELKEAKIVAETANAAKSSFLATMSHEIRTPMNGILVMAELLARTKMQPQHKRYADVIVRSGESLMAIINDILDFSKIESGKMTLEHIKMDVSETTNHVLNLFWDRAQSAKIDIASHIAPDVPDLIKGDPVRINQIISNLMNNALKFTKNGTVFLTVARSDEKSKSGKCMLEFSVTDTGIGIAEEKLGDIFKSFSQADQSTTRQFGGTGLGLAICKKLVEAMGGEISVTSQIGKGSTFKFTLPTQDLDKTRSINKKPMDRPLNGSTERAIVVQLTPATSMAICNYLEDHDIDVQTIPADELETVNLSGVRTIFATAQILQTLSLRDMGNHATKKPVLVVVSSPGDLDDASVFELGLAQDMLMCPIDRTDMRKLVDRLNRGELQGCNREDHQSGTMNNLPRFSGMRVLVADDNEINLEVAKEALAQLNIDVAFAHNGREAVDALSGDHYDAILMDCSMPVLSGFDATREIRATESQNDKTHIPIIALTAHIAGGITDEWKDAGMDRYLTKPFNITDLSAILSELCSTKLLTSASTDHAMGRKDTPQELDYSAPVLSDDSGSTILDTSQLSSITGLGDAAGQEMIVRILMMFTEHAPAAMKKLNEEKNTHTNDIANAAHALKSMCSNIGADRLFNACEALEIAARQNDLDDLAELIGKVEMELDCVLHHIEQRRLAA